MKSIAMIIKGHLLSLVSLLIYSCMWLYWLNIEDNYAKSTHDNAGPSVGEGIVYGFLMLGIVGIVLTFAMLLKGILTKHHRIYYFIVCALFATPVIVLVVNFINSLQN